MNLIKKIGLAGVGPFKTGTTLAIEPGISFLYGKNMTGKSPGSANMAGKSLFASSLVEIFYDSPLVGLKEDKNKTGHRFIEFQRGKNLIRISSKFDKKEVLGIKVNGKPLEARTKTITKDFLKEYWPLSESEFTTYGYLDSRVPHPLARGSSLDRKAFFTSFFGLDKIDQSRKIFQTHLLKIKKVKAAYTELHQAYTDLKKDLLDPDTVTAYELKVKKLQKQVDSLKLEFTEWQEHKRLTAFLDYAGPKLKAFRKLVPNLDDFEVVYTSLQTEASKALKYERQFTLYNQYKKELEAYKEKIKDLDMETPLEELKGISEKYARAQTLTRHQPVKPTEIKSVAKPRGEYKSLLVKAAGLEHELEHYKKFKTGKCYACGQSVKLGNINSVKTQLEETQSSIAQFQKWERYQKDLELYETELDEWTTARNTYEKAKKYIETHKDIPDLYALRRTLTKPNPVTKPAFTVSPTLVSDVELLEFFRPHLDTIAKCNSIKPVEDFDMGLLDTLSAKLAELNSKLGLHSTIKAKAETLKSRLRELKADMEREEALNLLVEAYSDKGIKRMAIEAISQHLMALVNRYAALVFDDYDFEFVWGSKIQILVHRPKEAPIDVRKLSGFESQMFTIILVISLLAFVPKSKRLSLLILDEPTASFSAEGIDLFHKFIPHLTSVIPSILIVTPKSDERLQGASEFTVLRTLKGATIVKGHPDQL